MGIYLDANGTYGLLPEVGAHLVGEFTPESPETFNPTAVHTLGQAARARVEQSRDTLRQLLGVQRDDGRLIWTSGATESNNCALMLPFWNRLKEGRLSSSEGADLIVSAVEHPSVLRVAERLEELGFTVARVSPWVDDDFATADLLEHVGPSTKLVSIMLANNETGQIFAVKEICQAVKALSPQTLFHTDAVQCVGRVPVSFSQLGVDMMSVSGHKVGALTGIGALVVRDEIGAEPLLLGAAQEQRWRSGTENVHGISSFGYAAEYLLENLESHANAMKSARDTFETLLGEQLPSAEINLRNRARLPNTSSVRFRGIAGADLVVALDLEQVYVSAGAACSSGKPLPSHVLLAHGKSDEHARETVRFSFRASSSEEEVKKAVSAVVRCVERMASLG